MKVREQVPFVATEAKRFVCGEDVILVEVQNDLQRFAWRMSVNGDMSDWSAYYQGILVHKGYGMVTAHFEDDKNFKEMWPFKIVPAVLQP